MSTLTRQSYTTLTFLTPGWMYLPEDKLLSDPCTPSERGVQVLAHMIEPVFLGFTPHKCDCSPLPEWFPLCHSCPHGSSNCTNRSLLHVFLWMSQSPQVQAWDQISFVRFKSNLYTNSYAGKLLQLGNHPQLFSFHLMQHLP